MSQFEKTTPAFADVLAVLHKACFEKAWNKDAFLSLLRLPTTVGLLNDAGFILCSVCGDEAEILTIGVLPSERKKGIAFALLTEMEFVLKEAGVSNFFLDVNETNIPALNLYAKFGFEQVGLRKAYYQEKGQTFDALLLKKCI